MSSSSRAGGSSHPTLWADADPEEEPAAAKAIQAGDLLGRHARIAQR